MSPRKKSPVKAKNAEAKKKKPAVKKATKKKKEEKPLTTLQKVALVQANIAQKTKGAARLSTGKDYTLPGITLRRPTGICSVDIGIGGGFPAGGIGQIIGEPSSGKTFIAMKTAAMVQQYYGEEFAGAVAMTEHRFDKLRAKSKAIGLRTSLSEDEIEELEWSYKENDPNFPGFTPEELDHYRDQVGAGMSEIVGDTAETLYEALLTAIRSNIFQIIIVDSLGAMLPALEAEGSMEDSTYSGAAGVNTKFMHKYSAISTALDEGGRSNETTLIFLNQVRDKIGGPKFAFGPQQTMSQQGGWAIKHGLMVNLYLASGSFPQEEGVTKSDSFFSPSAKFVHWNVMKQKSGGHEGARGKYLYDFDEGVDIVGDLIGMGLVHEVVNKGGAWYSLLGFDRNEEEALIGPIQGFPKFRAALMEMPNLVDYLRSEIMKEAGLGGIRHGPIRG